MSMTSARDSLRSQPRSSARRSSAFAACLGGDGLQQPFEQSPTIGPSMGGLDDSLGVRHQTKHLPAIVEDAGDVASRAIAFLKISERDAAFAFEAIERLGVRLVVAVVVSDRQ